MNEERFCVNVFIFICIDIMRYLFLESKIFKFRYIIKIILEVEVVLILRIFGKGR